MSAKPTPAEVAAQDQRNASGRDLAAYVATMYNTLVADGVPRIDAIQIIGIWIRASVLFAK